MAFFSTVERNAFVVVGVDFGTTFTGVAYTYSDDPDLKYITIINDWSGTGMESRHKVPTELSYENPNNIQWGWNLRPGTPRYGGFKLLLDPSAAQVAYNDQKLALTLDPGDSSIQSSLHPGRSATDMTTDYLRLVYTETMEKLNRRFPRTIDMTKIKFVITTPAMWSTAAQKNTLEAAKAAGFGSRSQDTIDIVTEPEAAAAYALREMCTHPSPNPFSSLLHGKQIIVCDAGGGTVDLVSYAIDQIDPCLEVSETTVPRGGLCGATSLDQRFLELVRQRLGQQSDFLDGRNSGRGSRLMLSFDNVKRNFGANDLPDDEPIEHTIAKLGPNNETIRLAPDRENRINDRFITLSHADIKSIFDPVVNKIINLVEDVYREATEKAPDKPVAGIVMAGGFGESTYLYRRLHSWAQQQRPRLFVVNPRDSWAAIAKGAVCVGLDNIVNNRILPCHYGVEMGKLYDPLIHDKRFNYTDPWTKVTYNCDAIEWFAEKGKLIHRGERIRVPFRFMLSGKRHAERSVRLRTCRYETPPISQQDARALRGPSITIDLGRLPASAFKGKKKRKFRVFGKSRELFVSDFTLEMVVGSASHKFEIWNNGELLASQAVDPGFVGISECPEYYNTRSPR